MVLEKPAHATIKLALKLISTAEEEQTLMAIRAEATRSSVSTPCSWDSRFRWR